MALSLDCEDDLVTSDELDMFVKLGQELPNVLYATLLPSLQNIVLSYLTCSVFLQSSIDDDDQLVEVNSQYLALRSEPFRMMLETNDTIYKLPFSTKVIQNVVQYVHAHKLHSVLPMPQQPVSRNMAENTICMFDVWFSAICDTTKDELAYTVCLANYFNIQSLMHLLCAKVASKIKGQPLGSIKRKLEELSSDVFTFLPVNCNCGFH